MILNKDCHYVVLSDEFSSLLYVCKRLIDINVSSDWPTGLRTEGAVKGQISRQRLK